jgi:excisionase family DNA binding protein
MHARKADQFSSSEFAGSPAERTTSNTVQNSAGLERLAYGIADAAFVSGISRSKLYELLKSGELASVKIGARRLIRARSLAELLERGCR